LSVLLSVRHADAAADDDGKDDDRRSKKCIDILVYSK